MIYEPCNVCRYKDKNHNYCNLYDYRIVSHHKGCPGPIMHEASVLDIIVEGDELTISDYLECDQTILRLMLDAYYNKPYVFSLDYLAGRVNIVWI